MKARGFALGQLPERFKLQSVDAHPQFAEYVLSKYGKHGFKRDKFIDYNPEYQVEHSTDRYRWIENISDGLRHAGKASDIIRLDHTGWFVDNFQDETVHGEVYQLPARDGESLFVPAVNDPWNSNCACVDFRSSTSDKEEAAHWADSMAEHWAEREREYQAKESAKVRLEGIETEIKEEYKDFRRISREIRANCDALKGIAVVRELVKDKWRETKAAIRKLRKEQGRIEQFGIEYD